jgi:hypothetical protein
MNRLLHAAAKGARIQALYQRHWIPANYLHLVECDYTYRIHPDDKHLQYGPISTLLREMALTGDCDGADIPHIRTTLKSTEDQKCVFCLILAEALADEGM